MSTDIERLVARLRRVADSAPLIRSGLYEQAADALEREHQGVERLTHDLDERWEHSPHLTAKYYGRMRRADAERDAAVQRAEWLKAAIREAYDARPSLGDSHWRSVDRMIGILARALDAEKGDGDANQ